MSLAWWQVFSRLSSLHAGRTSRRRASVAPKVEALEDRQLLAILMVTNTADSGPGSLRQALLDADNTHLHLGQNTIDFAISSSGAVTISPVSPLPALTNPAGIILDGTSEPGYAGKPLIVLSGKVVGGGNGLVVAGGQSTVKGLVINHYSNRAAGLVLASSNNTVQGNFVGTDAAGKAAIPNYYGIYVPAGATNNTIGGTTAGARNVISGNSMYGVLIEGGASSVVEGNFIGTDVTGTVALPNRVDGVAITAGVGNTIGGTGAGAGNLLSGNGRFGLFLTGAGTTDNVVQGNLIGLDKNGSAKVPNIFEGVQVLHGASTNTIGGTVAGAGNIIAGNRRSGVLLGNLGTDNNLVEGNYLGTDASGAGMLGNGGDGVAIATGAANNTIGGTNTAARNVLSRNTYAGVVLQGDGTTGNVIEGNFIGVTAGGSALPNGRGVEVSTGASGNTIGGTATGAGNVISGNQGPGLRLYNAGTSGNLIQGNFIGTSAGGTGGIPNVDGVVLELGAAGNTVGGTTPQAANVIAFNTGTGVVVGLDARDATTVGDAILGNSIHDNGGRVKLGIDLGRNGATANDSAGHTASNHFENFPVPKTVTLNANGSVTVAFTFASVPSSTFRIEFFLNKAPEAAQGHYFLGSVDLTTDASGAPASVSGGGSISARTVTVTLTPPAGLTAVKGQRLTSTATVLTTSSADASPGDTSEFSFPVIAVG
jgi:titin